MSLYDTLMQELANYDIGLFSKPEQERRIATCQSCDKFNADNHTCSVCKCSVAVRVLMSINSCPDGKWAGEKK